VVNQKALGQAQIAAAAAQDKYNKTVQKYGRDSIQAQVAQAALFKAQDKVKEATKGTVGPLTEAMKVQARTSLLTKGLSKAHGDLARTQNSVSNQAKMLQGRVQNLAADMGAKLLPAASAVLGGLIGLVSALPQVAGYLQDNQKTIGIVAGIITAILLPALISWGVQSTISAAKSVAAWVTTQAKALASSYAQMGAAVRVVAGWVMMGAAAVKSGAQTVAIWALYKAEAIKGAAVWVAQQARVVAATVAAAATQAATMAATVARTVAGWVLMGVQSLIQAARMAAAWVIAMGPVGWVIAAVVALAVLIYKNWDTIVNATKVAWTAVTDFLKAAWAWIKSAATATWNGIKAAIGAALGLIKALVVAYFTAYKTVILAVWNAIKSATSSALNGVKSVISSAWSWVKSTTSSAWNGIKSAVSNSVNGLLGVVRGIPGRIKGALGNLASLLWNSGQRIMQGLADGIRAGLGRVTGAVRNVLSAARNLLPFSPAKTGPFSGRGWTLYSGRSISAALAKGMGQNVSQVRKAALGMAEAAVPSFGAVQGPGVTPGAVGASRGSQARGGGLRPSEMAASARANSGHTIYQTINYPVAEKTSVATNRGLQRIATLPVGG
jgi:phage-related protein